MLISPARNALLDCLPFFPFGNRPAHDAFNDYGLHSVLPTVDEDDAGELKVG